MLTAKSCAVADATLHVSSQAARGIVVCELHEWQEFRPVVLLISAIDVKVLLKQLANPLNLSVHLGMMSGSEVDLDTK